MFHNPDFFQDAESFIPERWLGDPRFDGDQKAALEPFSVGPRNCIGKKYVMIQYALPIILLTRCSLAYAEMRLILAKMIWHFDFKLDRRSEGWLEKSVVHFLWVKPELHIRLTPRA